MTRETVYIESTIRDAWASSEHSERPAPSYLAAEPSENIKNLNRQILTGGWWRKERTKYNLVTSQVTMEEVANGESGYAEKRLDLIKNIDILPIVDEVDFLVDYYMNLFHFPDKILQDMYHVSLCVHNKIHTC